MSQPHTVPLVKVEQTVNSIEDVSTDPLHLLVKMRECGQTLEQYFRDRCDKRKRRRHRPERVDLDDQRVIAHEGNRNVPKSRHFHLCLQTELEFF